MALSDRRAHVHPADVSVSWSQPEPRAALCLKTREYGEFLAVTAAKAQAMLVEEAKPIQQAAAAVLPPQAPVQQPDSDAWKTEPVLDWSGDWGY